MKPTEELCLVYMTAASMEEAKHLGRILVKQNLAACVNLLDGMTSIYKWREHLEEGREVVMIAKTAKTNMSQIIEIINKNHSYECPCILELPIQGGHPEFLRWIGTETKNQMESN